MHQDGKEMNKRDIEKLMSIKWYQRRGREGEREIEVSVLTKQGSKNQRHSRLEAEYTQL